QQRQRKNSPKAHTLTPEIFGEGRSDASGRLARELSPARRKAVKPRVREIRLSDKPSTGPMQKNPFRAAQYLISAHRLDQLPADAGAEIAFAGRSNAGKSSALNRICDQQGLARTSKTPGRTQQLVVFLLDDAHRLIDLPGYGYAKVPDKLRDHWR